MYPSCIQNSRVCPTVLSDSELNPEICCYVLWIIISLTHTLSQTDWRTTAQTNIRSHTQNASSYGWTHICKHTHAHTLTHTYTHTHTDSMFGFLIDFQTVPVEQIFETKSSVNQHCIPGLRASLSLAIPLQYSEVNSLPLREMHCVLL